MSNKITCLRGYVNKLKFTENDNESKNRLNLTVGSNLLGIKIDEKCYITYEVTLWGKQAVKYSESLKAGKSGNGAVVSFVGELKKVGINEYEGKTYVNHIVDVAPIDFNVISEGSAEDTPSEKKTEKKVSKQSKLEDEDDI